MAGRFALDEESYLSVLLWFQPRNSAVMESLETNRTTPGLVQALQVGANVFGVLHIAMKDLKDPTKQQRGVALFGPNPVCDIRLMNIDMNNSSAELVLHQNGRCIHQCFLDDQAVEPPRQRALVSGHAEFLRIGKSNFQLHWLVADEELSHRYQNSKTTFGQAFTTRSVVQRHQT